MLQFPIFSSRHVVNLCRRKAREKERSNIPTIGCCGCRTTHFLFTCLCFCIFSFPPSLPPSGEVHLEGLLYVLFIDEPVIFRWNARRCRCEIDRGNSKKNHEWFYWEITYETCYLIYVWRIRKIFLKYLRSIDDNRNGIRWTRSDIYATEPKRTVN